jgi:hypothetical protein
MLIFGKEYDIRMEQEAGHASGKFLANFYHT